MQRPVQKQYSKGRLGNAPPAGPSESKTSAASSSPAPNSRSNSCKALKSEINTISQGTAVATSPTPAQTNSNPNAFNRNASTSSRYADAGAPAQGSSSNPNSPSRRSSAKNMPSTACPARDGQGATACKRAAAVPAVTQVPLGIIGKPLRPILVHRMASQQAEGQAGSRLATPTVSSSNRSTPRDSPRASPRASPNARDVFNRPLSLAAASPKAAAAAAGVDSPNSPGAPTSRASKGSPLKPTSISPVESSCAPPSTIIALNVAPAAAAAMPSAVLTSENGSISSSGSILEACARLGIEAGLTMAESLLKRHTALVLSGPGQLHTARTDTNSSIGQGYPQHLPDNSSSSLFPGAMDTALFATMGTLNPLFGNQSPSSSLSSSLRSGNNTMAQTAGATAVTAAAAASAAAAAAAAEGRFADTGAEGNTVVTNANDGFEDASMQSNTLFEILNNNYYKGRSVLQWLAKQSNPGAASAAGSSGGYDAGSFSGSGGSIAVSELKRLQQGYCQPSFAKSSFSVDCSQLSEIIKERVSTHNLIISTDIAPDTSRFSLQSRNSRTPDSGLGQSVGDQATDRSDLPEVLEIVHSADGDTHNPAEPAAAAASKVPATGSSTLQPGDLIYEFVPTVAREILSWSGVSHASVSSFGSVGTLGTLHSSMHMTARSSMDDSAGQWPRLSDDMSRKGPTPVGSTRGFARDTNEIQRMLRQHCLLDTYVQASTSALLGTQAALLTALSGSGCKKSNPEGAAAAEAAQAGEFKIASYAGGAGVWNAPAPIMGKKKEKRLSSRQLHKIVSTRMQREVWQPQQGYQPLKIVWSPLGVLTCLAYLGVAIYYFNVRIAFTLTMGATSWYGAVVLGCEVIGFTAVVPYCLMLLRRCTYVGSGGLPADDGRWKLPKSKRFCVRVLIPCYKESLECIKSTVGAALAADMPPSCSRVIYLCDDGKDKAKEAYITTLKDAAVYVSGRTRKPGEINGKSGNLNNCLKNIIYSDYVTVEPPADATEATLAAAEAASAEVAAADVESGPAAAAAAEQQGDAGNETEAAVIPPQEVVVVFDADMACKNDFFRHVLEVMWDDEVGLCLTPQAFSNIHPAADIWNNINPQFWEYILPGCDALGYVGCTGTNFCVRAQALQKVGWFPEWTITEDYALSLELKAAGVKGRYLPKYLAEGEAPEEIHAVLQQRSRWTKGHMQVFFSKRCPLFHPKLPLLHKILYNNGTWAYFCTIITTFLYTLVPFVSLVFGVHPVALSGNFTLAATLYFAVGAAVNFHVRNFRHFQAMWLSLIANHLLAFTYFKATYNTLLSIWKLKAKGGFKATAKKAGAPAPTGLAAVGQKLVAALSSFTVSTLSMGPRMNAMQRPDPKLLKAIAEGAGDVDDGCNSTIQAAGGTDVPPAGGMQAPSAGSNVLVTGRSRRVTATSATTTQDSADQCTTYHTVNSDTSASACTLATYATACSSAVNASEAAGSLRGSASLPRPIAEAVEDDEHTFSHRGVADVMYGSHAGSNISSPSQSACSPNVHCGSVGCCSAGTSSSGVSSNTGLRSVSEMSGAGSSSATTSASGISWLTSVDGTSGAGGLSGYGSRSAGGSSSSSNGASSAGPSGDGAAVAAAAAAVAAAAVPGSSACASVGESTADTAGASAAAVSTAGASAILKHTSAKQMLLRHNPVHNSTGSTQDKASMSAAPSNGGAASTAAIDSFTAAAAAAEVPKPKPHASCCIPVRSAAAAAKSKLLQKPAPSTAGSNPDKKGRFDWLHSNVVGLGWKLDPWVLLVSLGVSVVAVAAGAWQIGEQRDRFDLGSAGGVQRVFVGGHMDEFMLLALLLGSINVIPPLLFFIYCFTKGRFLQFSVYVGQAVNAGLFTAAVIVLWLLTPPSHNLEQALQLSSMFLQAQRSTAAALTNTTIANILPSASNGTDGISVAFAAEPWMSTALDLYPWLKEGATGNPADLVQGGYYMGADYVKHTMPLATNMAMLAWSLMEFAPGIEQAGVLQQLQVSLKVGAQYLMDCHVAPGVYVARIGNPKDYVVNITAKSGFWGDPDKMPADRTPLLINATAAAAAAAAAASSPTTQGAGADVLAAATAALAATSMALKPTQPAFAAAALELAQQLYQEAVVMQPLANVTYEALFPGYVPVDFAGPVLGVQDFGSSSVLDDMAHAAAWLAKATGSQAMYQEASSYLTRHWEQEAAWTSAPYYWPNHENMAWQAAVLLVTEGSGLDADACGVHRQALSLMFRGWLAGMNKYTSITSPTPQGLPWASDRPLATAAATSLLGMLWVSTDNTLLSAVKHRLQCVALDQATYILGRNRRSQRFLVGYRNNYPEYPAHRLASVFGSRTAAGTRAEAMIVAGEGEEGAVLAAGKPSELTGALVAGPLSDDSYTDSQIHPAQSSIGLHHNVPLIGMLAGLLTSRATPGQCAAGQGMFQLMGAHDLP